MPHGESFYKIINPFIMETGLLRIPNKFIARHGNCLPNEVVLQVPSGMVWRIKVRKVDGYVCLESGWREFMEYHSLFVGHFLVFRYDWNSQFAVLIFNMSGSEIEYLSFSNNIRQADLVQDAAHPTPEEDPSFANGDSSGRDIETEESDTHSVFNSNYPFFKVNVTPTYANRKCMTMPITFYRSHIPEGTDRLTLQCSNGKRKWLVRCSLNCRGTVMRIFGLAGFISENNIKVGDICFFELIDKINVVLKANILSLADAEDSSTRTPVKIREDNTAPASNFEFSSNHPFFKTNVAPTYMDKGYC